MNKIRKGDQVIVLTGRDKGKRGAVASRVDDDHVIVEGINMVKKHVKPNPMKGTTGGVVDKTMPIDQSTNLICIGTHNLHCAHEAKTNQCVPPPCHTSIQSKYVSRLSNPTLAMIAIGISAPRALLRAN